MNWTLAENTTLLEALRTYLPDSSRRTLQHWIKGGRILVDGTAVLKEHELLQAGQVLSMGKKEAYKQVHGISILYQDRWMIVIDKPKGLLSVPKDNNLAGINALEILQEEYDTHSIFPVHRIDQDTSGVLLFARGTRSEEAFDALFEQHALQRQYIGIVEGRLASNQGTWESYLKEKENYDVIETSSVDGKLAITHYEVLKRSKNFSCLRLTLETGRKHQIRVHCAQAGHPIVGDKRYGALTNPLRRVCLHALSLGFVHPFTQKSVVFTSLPPPAFARIGFDSSLVK